jgi:hypothetical protein
MVKRDLDIISSHIQNDSVLPHSHVRANFDDSLGSLVEKNESFILYTGENLGRFGDVQFNHSVFAWFNFGNIQKKSPGGHTCSTPVPKFVSNTCDNR